MYIFINTKKPTFKILTRDYDTAILSADRAQYFNRYEQRKL